MYFYAAAGQSFCQLRCDFLLSLVSRPTIVKKHFLQVGNAAQKPLVRQRTAKAEATKI